MRSARDDRGAADRAQEKGRTTAATILEALQAKHFADLYTEELCLGPALSQRLDAWAAPRSWANWATHGYEVKVSRGDWMSDQKLHHYREYVHHLWIVCPWGLIPPNEVPDFAGLLWLTKTGARLLRKKLAPRQDPAQVMVAMQSALLGRARLARRGGRLSDGETRRSMLEAVVEDEKRRKEIGWIVGGHVRELQSKVDSGERAIKRLEAIEQRLRDAGFHYLEAALEAAVNGKAALDAKALRRALGRVEQAVRGARELLPEEAPRG